MRRCFQPLAVVELVQCEQHREVRSGKAAIRLVYRVTPDVPGRLRLTWDGQRWAAAESFGTDVAADMPLVCVEQLAAVLPTTGGVPEMEAALAAYFNCDVVQSTAAGRRVKASQPTG